MGKSPYAVTLKAKVNPMATVEDASEALCQIASDLKCPVEAKFNSVRLVANPGDSPQKLIEMWSAHSMMQRGNHA